MKHFKCLCCWFLEVKVPSKFANGHSDPQKELLPSAAHVTVPQLVRSQQEQTQNFLISPRINADELKKKKAIPFFRDDTDPVTSIVSAKNEK